MIKYDGVYPARICPPESGSDRWQVLLSQNSVSVLETAGEGGPWGMAVLASYLVNKKNETLDEFLEKTVFANSKAVTTNASKEDIEGFNKFFENYTKGLAVEKAAVESLA